MLHKVRDAIADIIAKRRDEAAKGKCTPIGAKGTVLGKRPSGLKPMNPALPRPVSGPARNPFPIRPPMHGGILAGPGPLVPPPLGPRPGNKTPTPFRPTPRPIAKSTPQREAPPIGTGFAPDSDVTIHRK